MVKINYNNYFVQEKGWVNRHPSKSPICLNTSTVCQISELVPWGNLKTTDLLGPHHPHSADGWTEAQSREGAPSKARAEQELGLVMRGAWLPGQGWGGLGEGAVHSP